MTYTTHLPWHEQPEPTPPSDAQADLDSLVASLQAPPDCEDVEAWFETSLPCGPGERYEERMMV